MGYIVTRETMERASALKRATANLTPAVLEQIINEAIESELAAGQICACDSCSCRKETEAEAEAPAAPEHRHYDDHEYGASFTQSG